MSCCPPPSACCTPAQLCGLDNYGLTFPSLVGPMGPPGGPGTYVESLAALRVIDASQFTAGYVAEVGGYAAVGDGGGGAFYYDPASVLVDNDGTIIRPANGIGRWIRKIMNWVIPAWFGAFGNGSNVTVPFQSAVTFAVASVLDIFAPGGTYVMTAQINITGALNIYGEGYSTNFNFTTAANGFAITADNVRIERARLSGATSRMIYAVKVAGTGLNLKDLDISGATVAPVILDIGGIYADGYSNVLVDHCYVHGCGQAASPRGKSIVFNHGVTSVSTNVVVNNCRVETTNATIGICFFNCTDSKALVNEVSGSSLDDPTASGYGIIFYKTVGAVADTNNNRALGNFVYNTQGTGIYLTNNDGTILQQNIIRNTAQSQTEATLTVGAIGLNVCSNMTVGPNTIITSGKNGIAMVGTNNVLSENNISSVAGYGVRFFTTAVGHSLTGNRITTAAIGMGTDTVTLTNCSFTGNHFTDCSTAAMFFANLTKCNVTGGSVDDVDYGFQILAGSKNSFVGTTFTTLTNKAIEYSGTTSLFEGIRIADGAVAGIDISGAAAGNGNRIRDPHITNTVNPVLTGDLAEVYVVTAGNPNALLGSVARLTYAGATNVTGITGGCAGNGIVTLYAANGNSTLVHGANFIMRTGANVVMGAGTTRSFVPLDNTTWAEIS